MSRRIVIVGGSGQLAHDLRPAWAARRPQDVVISMTHDQIEVTDHASVRSTLRPIEPDLVVNTAAYHKVDVVEDDPDLALAVNTLGVRNLALVCRELEAPLVHLSTDYVFAGDARSPRVESDPVAPVNVYGVSKAAGEMLLRFLWERHFIVRSSGLYGVAGSSGNGGNFVETMLRLAAGEEPIRVVDDQVLTPTGTVPLAAQIVELAETDRYGTYHATCGGECSWFEFAAEIFRQAGVSPTLLRQTTAQSGARARRPAYSVLENRALRGLDLDRMPSWQDSLRTYMEARTAAGSIRQ